MVRPTGGQICAEVCLGKHQKSLWDLCSLVPAVPPNTSATLQDVASCPFTMTFSLSYDAWSADFRMMIMAMPTTLRLYIHYWIYIIIVSQNISKWYNPVGVCWSLVIPNDIISNTLWYLYGCVAKPIIINVSGLNTNINPSYFDVNRRATRFWPKVILMVY